MLTMPSTHSMVNFPDNAQVQVPPGPIMPPPRRSSFNDEQIRQFTVRGARPRTQCPSGPPDQRNSSFFNSPESEQPPPPAEPQPSTSAQAQEFTEQFSSGLFGPSFLQGFFVNCSICRQKNKASAKCYECNSYLCEKCVFSHAKGRVTSFHHIYHFDSLAERLSPTVTGVLTQPTATPSTTNSEDQTTSNNLAPSRNGAHPATSTSCQTGPVPTGNHVGSRVVGAGRRSSSENSRDSSRTSSVNLTSPTESRRESYEAVTSVQAAINSISLSVSNSNHGMFSPGSPLSFHSGTPSPPVSRPAVSSSPPNAPPPIGSAPHPIGSAPTNQTDISTNQNAAVSRSTNQKVTLIHRGNTEASQDVAASVIHQRDSGDASNCISLNLNQFEMGRCARHQSEFRFFCTDCMIPICTRCLQEKHMDHSLIYITEGLQKVNQMSHDLNNQIREINVGLRQALDGLQRMCEGIDYRAHQVAIDVKCTIRRFITALEARQDDILQRLEQARQVKLRLINFQMENIRLYYSKLARALDLINDPSRFSSPLENMAANHQAFRELRQAKNLGTNIFPCEDDGFMFMPPSDSQLHSIAFMGHLHVSSAPITNSVMLCRQPLLYMNSAVSIPEYPLPAAKARPIFGCRDIVAVKDFGRAPKLIWGKAGPEDGELCRPWGITINRFGQIIIADRSNNRIQVFDTDGRYLFQFGTHGSRNGQFDRPAAVAVSPNDDLVIADKDNHRVQVFNRTGEFLFTFGERGSQIGQFMYPWDVACDSMGNILVSDARNHRIQLFRWNGIFIAKWGGELSMPRLFDTPRGVAFDPMGNILMTDFNMHRVVMIERLTGKVRYIGREGKERGQFNRPQGICCDDRGWFVVADSRNYRFQVFNDKGEFMWMVGRQGKEDPGEFDRPCDVCVDPEGHIHLMDFGNDRIQVF